MICVLPFCCPYRVHSRLCERWLRAVPAEPSPTRDSAAQRLCLQQFATAVYQSELTYRVRQLGYEITTGRRGAPEIKGYTQEYLDASSPRSQQIREYLERTGRSGKQPAEIAAHSTALGGSPREIRVRERDEIQKASVAIPAALLGTTRLTGVTLRTAETERALARAKSLPPTADQLRNRELDRGLIAILESMPHSAHHRELVDIVNLAEEGKSQRLLTTSKKQGVKSARGTIKGAELHATEIGFNAAINFLEHFNIPTWERFSC